MARLIFICFLIMSCDLDKQASTDCNGLSFGSAYRDDCGRCVEGDTGLIAGIDKDSCGECFGDGDCLRCNDQSAINYVEVNEQSSFIVDNNLCVYDLCTDYIPFSNTSFSCDDSQETSTYQIGDQLRCEDIDDPINICYPSDCGDFKLSDLYGKVTWIELTTSWWNTCYQHGVPELDDIALDYMNNKDVLIISVLYDVNQPYSCTAWGANGNSELPIVINGGASLTSNGSNSLESLFFDNIQIPKRVFIDHELRVHYKFAGYESKSDIKEKINEMLENMEINWWKKF